MMMDMNLDARAELMMDARYPILYITSWEEDRMLERIARMAEHLQSSTVIWSYSKGVHGNTVGQLEWQSEHRESKDGGPIAALEFVLKYQPGAGQDVIFVLKDFHPFLRDAGVAPMVIRKLRDIAAEFRARPEGTSGRRNLILLSPVLYLPPELEKDVTILDYPLPDLDDLRQVWADVRGEFKTVQIETEQEEQLLRAAQGLTANESESVFRKLIYLKRGGKIESADVDYVTREKEQIVLKSRTLEFCTPTDDFSSVGGMGELKDWLKKRSLAFTDAAREFGLPEPKGMLLLGVPGCGKSMCAKVVAAEWHKPLLRLDIGRIFGGTVGSSEENIRAALKIAEGVSPCILWLDEIEKGFVGMHSGGDSGVTARVFGTMLTWMQEKTKPVFVIATANDIRSLPPELLRKGRFDEIFFVDLPSPGEREDIFRVHIRKRANKDNGLDIVTEKLNYAEYARRSEGFSGAEIEQAVESALFDSFFRHQSGKSYKPEYDGLVLKALADVVPLSKAMQDTVQALRRWAETRARFASGVAGSPKAQGMPIALPTIAAQRLNFGYESETGKKFNTLQKLAIYFQENRQEGMRALQKGFVAEWLKTNNMGQAADDVAKWRDSPNAEYAVQEFIEQYKGPVVQ
jgi:AAA+ superfamily predicted ATPase